MKPLATDTDVAELLGTTIEDVRLKCRATWPCVKPKRGQWRFTEAMVEQIIAMESVTHRKAPTELVSTQTKRSRARSA